MNRPIYLESFIGQNNIKNTILLSINAAKKTDRKIDHMMFYGPPGLGKTTLANIIAKEMDSPIKLLSGATINKAGEIAAILTNIEQDSVLFIDEIHRLPISVEELLYTAMEDSRIDIIVGDGPGARSISINLPRFTLIGATTKLGLISAPLRDRFGLILRLEYYAEEEISLILENYANIFNIVITECGKKEIAQRSRGTPRIAGKLFRRVFDYITVNNIESINNIVVNQALNIIDIDENGLDYLDRKYLKYLSQQNCPVGIETLSVALSEQKKTLEDVIEPYLIQKGLIQKTQKGRIITNSGIKILDL